MKHHRVQRFGVNAALKSADGKLIMKKVKTMKMKLKRKMKRTAKILTLRILLLINFSN